MRTRLIAVAATLLVVSAIPATVVADGHEQQAYTGTHVSFETGTNALVDYQVNNETVLDGVRVQSQGTVESEVGLTGSADVSGVAGLSGAGLSLQRETDARASVTTESGAAIDAHDNGHGSLVVTASDGAQYVELNVSEGAETTQADEKRVVIGTDGGTQATAIVVGQGQVTTNEGGNVTASLESDSRLVVRSYTDGRSTDDRIRERMIANGTIAASAYVTHQDGEAVTDTVNYSTDTSVEVSERTEGRVEMTVERSASEGRVVIAKVSEETFGATEDIFVQVDGEAAARVSSYAELRQATRGASTSKYMVQQSSAAEASGDAEVLVGINHFSTRDVTMTDSSADTSEGESSTDTGTDTGESGSGDDTTGGASDGDSDTDTDGTPSGGSSDGESRDGDGTTPGGDGPGFGIVAGLLALLVLAGFATRSLDR